MQGMARMRGGDRQAAGEQQLDPAQRRPPVAPGDRHAPQVGGAWRDRGVAIERADHPAPAAVAYLEDTAGAAGALRGGHGEPFRQQRLEVEVARAVSRFVDAPRARGAVGLADVVDQDEAPVILRIAGRGVPPPRFHGSVVEYLQVRLPAAELRHVPAAPHQLQVAFAGGGPHPFPAGGAVHVQVQAGDVREVAAADQEVDAGAGDGEHLRLQLADQGAQIAVLAVHQAPALKAGHRSLAGEGAERRLHAERRSVGPHLAGVVDVEWNRAGIPGAGHGMPSPVAVLADIDAGGQFYGGGRRPDRPAQRGACGHGPSASGASAASAGAAGNEMVSGGKVSVALWAKLSIIRSDAGHTDP